LKGKLMIRSKVLLAIGAMLMATFIVGGPAPASADPTGTTFSVLTDNFQLDTDPSPWDPLNPFAGGLDSFSSAVPFGVSTFIPEAGVTVSSMVSISPPIPELGLVGGLEFIEIWVDTFTPDATTEQTGDGGFLNADPLKESALVINGLNWGDDPRPAVGTGLLFLQFDIDGVIQDLQSALTIPIVPNPLNGGDSIPIDIAGDDVSTLGLLLGDYGGEELVDSTLFGVLTAFGIPFNDAQLVNSIHFGFEVTHVPEPATMALLGVGLCSTVLMHRRRR
jgi:hypothetical protein